MKAEHRPKYLVIAALVGSAVVPLIVIVAIDLFRGTENTEAWALLWLYYVAPTVTILAVFATLVFWVHDFRKRTNSE